MICNLEWWSCTPDFVEAHQAQIVSNAAAFDLGQQSIVSIARSVGIGFYDSLTTTEVHFEVDANATLLNSTTISSLVSVGKDFVDAAMFVAQAPLSNVTLNLPELQVRETSGPRVLQRAYVFEEYIFIYCSSCSRMADPTHHSTSH